MKKPTHAEVKVLISDLLLPFYHVTRDMHVPSLGASEKRNENDAEHSWSVAVLACALAPHVDESLDIGLVCQFAVVHDLVEVYADDTSVWADGESLASKNSREAEALEKIKSNFSHFPWLITTLEAYERQDCDEAVYVRAVDKYIAMVVRFMDGGEYYRSVGITKEIFDKNLTSHREKAHQHPGVAEYYERIRAEYDSHPEHFST